MEPQTTSHKVCVYALNEKAEEVLQATCVLDGDAVSCSGDETFVKNLLTHGVYHVETGKTVFPKDGVVFLQALPSHFDSGHLTAVRCE